MKKLLCGFSALAITAMPLTAFADTAIDENTPEPKQADVVISTEIAPAYIVTIPADTTVKFNDTSTDFGSVELTKAQLEPDHIIQFSIDCDGELNNSTDDTKVIPYKINATLDGYEEVYPTQGTLFGLNEAGDKLNLTIDITEENWKKAHAGKYGDTVIFNIKYILDETGVKFFDLGNTKYRLVIPKTFNEGEPAQEDVADSLQACMRSSDSDLVFCVYKFKKPLSYTTLANYADDEAFIYSASEKNIENKINNIDAPYFNFKGKYDDVDYNAVTYLLETDEDVIEVVLRYTENDTAALVTEIMNTLIK